MTKILLSIYIAFLLTKIFPFSAPISPLAIFIVIAIVVFLLLSQAKVFKKEKRFSGREFILTFLIICLLLTIALSFSKIALLEKLPPQLQQVFVSNYSLFAWFAAPLLALALVKKKSKDKE
ncbi:MAG: hypothetical protein ABIG90_01330 [bacterium]